MKANTLVAIPSVGKTVACTACLALFALLVGWVACTMLIPDVIGVPALDFSDPSTLVAHGIFLVGALFATSILVTQG